MKRNVLVHFLSALLMFTVFSCREKKDDLITEKIVYDVQIRNTDPQVDWWTENLPGPARDNLVERIFDAVSSGRMSAWSETGKQLSDEEVENIGRRTLKLQLPNPDPPYTPKDTTIVQELNLRDITRIRFLETWYYNSSGVLINKEVNGMAPVMENYGPDGELRGYEALFWIYQDKLQW